VSSGLPYEIRYSNEAVAQLRKLRVFDRTAILDQVEQVLNVNPTVVGKAGIKRLREPAPTQYRLRVGEFRVFSDVEEPAVLIIQILSKQDSHDYLGGSS
jgi:mRNA interferase RelE/StbE